MSVARVGANSQIFDFFICKKSFADSNETYFLNSGYDLNEMTKNVKK
jgi:hypothetical protein